MSKANNLTDFLTNIANAIRAKKGTSATINPQDFETEIANLSDKFSGVMGGTVTTLTAQDLVGVTEIVPYRFYHDETLQSITFPDTLITIGNNAFEELVNGVHLLENVNFGNGLQNISKSSFLYCKNIREIILPDSITTIGIDAFNTCSGATRIVVGASATNIGRSSFYGCTSLTSITVKATTPPTLQNKNAFTSTNNCPIYVPSASVDAYKAATNWSSYASRIQAIPS